MDLNPDMQTEVIKKLETLTANPFRQGTKKIEGKQNIYRGRIGDFRYYFRLINESKSIEVLMFDIRGNIKHKKIHKL
jgi:mRNA-degrading endonuclease RelE of RelBE toxin-antitoxin system